jgi:hypothetical protein
MAEETSKKAAGIKNHRFRYRCLDNGWKTSYLPPVLKIKIGAQLEENVFHDLQVAAASEKRAINEIVQEAIATYLRQKGQSRGKSGGLGRFNEPDPLRLTPKQLRETMDADFFDQ